VVTQSFVNSLQERFNVQLVDGFETANTEVFQSESKALITERAIARTTGVAEAVAAGNLQLNALIRPLAINAHAPLVQVLDASGALIYGLRSIHKGLPLMRPQLCCVGSGAACTAGESDSLGDKFSGVLDGSDGPTLYVAGPLLLNNQSGRCSPGRLSAECLTPTDDC